MSTTTTESTFIRATSLAELQTAACQTLSLNGHILALWYVDGQVYAVDNRCPHMGFPLDRGSVKDGILTCHWHHARFDLESGGTFDQWADDVRAFPVEIRDGDVWVNLASQRNPKAHQQERLQVGLERNLSLVIGKAVLTLVDGKDGQTAVAPFRIGLEFGTRYRNGGWGQGLTILTCLMNLLPHLNERDRPRALYNGLAAVASDTFGSSPRFMVRPLPDTTTDIATLKRWFRQFIEVRDDEGAERCIISAIEAGASPQQMADMLFTAVTDHRYIQIGHPADFTNKAFEALDIVGWEFAGPVLTSLVMGYAQASRMEESNAWRHPIDLIEILHEAFAQLPNVVAAGEKVGGNWNGRNDLVPLLLADDPQASITALLNSLAAGASPVELAEAVTYAAALRVARFHTSNEFGDWDTALHTFTFANAIMQGLRRAPSVALLRGVFDAAMSIYLDRFLNIPAARIPTANGQIVHAGNTLEQFPPLLNQQQQVNEAAVLVTQFIGGSGHPDDLLAMLGHLLLREDRDFHTIQCVEAAFNLFSFLQGTEAGTHALIAAARYLAAHSPTVRAQGQTYQIAARLHQGEHLFADD
ncbi:MAG: Rieske (2Fe-2S) protein [Ardenticatenaceae bacterium]|nr:Rieske (2Fe-2S) protein [Ardenticatenaceae bacterium]